MAAAALLGACAQNNPTPLPDLKRPAADAMLKPAQQESAIAEIARKKAEEQEKAVKQIESSR